MFTIYYKSERKDEQKDSKQPDVPARSIGVFGGGPAGLAFALRFIDFCRIRGLKPIITVYDTRWKKDKGKISHLENQRQQVVTLQEEVLNFMGIVIKDTLIADCPKIWGPSYNVPISLVEDRLMALAQGPIYSDCIRLVPASKDELTAIYYQEEHLKTFDDVVVADGSRSSFLHSVLGMARETASIQPDSALGIYFEGPHRAPNECVLLTLINRRYLLNGDPILKRGFLNVALSSDEAKAVKEYGGEDFDTWRKNWKDRNPEFQNVFRSIAAGLKLFGISEFNAKTINFIELDLSFSPDFCFDLPSRDKSIREKKAWVIGDAAFATHFWPGRGMNSALKEAAQLAWTLFNPKKNNELEFSGWMTKLRLREHTKRSKLFLCRVGMGLAIDLTKNDTRELSVLITSLRARAEETLRFLCGRTDWNFAGFDITRFSAMLEHIPLRDLRIMDHSGSWPSASGNEVLPDQEILNAQPQR